MKFRAKQQVATANVMAQFPDQDWTPYLERHYNGDWGNVCEEDLHTNNQYLESGSMVMSVFEVNGKTVWIITDGAEDPVNRDTTTILMPEDY